MLAFCWKKVVFFWGGGGRRQTIVFKTIWYCFCCSFYCFWKLYGAKVVWGGAPHSRNIAWLSVWYSFARWIPYPSWWDMSISKPGLHVRWLGKIFQNATDFKGFWRSIMSYFIKQPNSSWQFFRKLSYMWFWTQCWVK